MNHQTIQCKSVEAQLDAWLSREATLTTQRTLTAHLTTCARCAASLTARQRVKTALARALAHDDPAPAALRAQIRQQLAWLRR
jgi:anti-sigma factor (TIGR02949 family)